MTVIEIIRKTASLKGIFILLLLSVAVVLFCTLYELPEDTGVSVSWSEYETVISGFDAADQKMIGQATDKLDRYFDAMEVNIDPFLDDIYSFSSKGKMLWYLLKDIKLKEVEGLNPYIMMLPPMIPVREGTSLPNFLETKFNHHFGSSREVKGELRDIVDGISSELAYNNERLAVELGELVSATLGNSEELAASVEAEGSFQDRAKDLSTAIVARTGGLQAGIELATLAADCLIAPSIATYVIAVLAAEGIIVTKGVASGLVTFGIGTAIAIAVDIVANKISRATLKPKIEKALQQRRSETISSFKKSIARNMRDYHRTRRSLIKKTLGVGFMADLKRLMLLVM